MKVLLLVHWACGVDGYFDVVVLDSATKGYRTKS